MTGVLVHDDWGVFCGCALGLAFWSNLDTAGQIEVPTSDNATDAETIKNFLKLEGEDRQKARHVILPPAYHGLHSVGVQALREAGVSEEHLAKFEEAEVEGNG